MARSVVLLAVLFAILACPVYVWGVPDDEGNADPTEGATYIGAKRCRKCHIKQHKTWKETGHSSAWETLPEEYRDEEQKDDSGRVCMSCHSTGYGQANRGGFEDPETSKHLLGVQCEACHGPGSKHQEAGQIVLDDKARKEKKFKEGEKTFITPKPAGCTSCHNPHVRHTKYKPK
ncbi:MAG: multiheme c-type cytochrome [Planctomycetota bacterium]|jgi:hypothetical protein